MSVEDAREAPPARHQQEISLLDIALVLAENLRTLILLPLAVALIALGITFAIPPTFTATNTLLPPQQQQTLAASLQAQLGVLAGPAAAAAGIKNPADTYVALLKSRTVADRLIERLDLKKRYDVKLDEQARRELESRTRISAGRDGLITISVDDHDPRRAADLANGYVEALITLTQTLAVTEAGQRRVFFERQLKQSRDDLNKAEFALRAAGINEATLKTLPQSALEFLANLKARVTAQEIKLAAMRGFMTEANPEFRQAENELAALRVQVAKAEESDPAKGDRRGADYLARLRDFKYQETLYELMAKQYQLARLDEAREGAVIQVVDPAVTPEAKSHPRRGQIAVVTALTTFFLALFVVFVRQAWRNAVADPEKFGQLTKLRQLLRLRHG